MRVPPFPVVAFIVSVILSALLILLVVRHWIHRLPPARPQHSSIIGFRSRDAMLREVLSEEPR